MRTFARFTVMPFALALALVGGATLLPALASGEPVTREDLAQDRIYSPYTGRSYPNAVFFGDTHVHTNLSPDAGLLGTTLSVDDAYNFAAGKTVAGNTGQPVQLVRPLDFLVITDHAEYIGLAPMIRNADPLLLQDEFGKWLYERFNSGPEGAFEGFAAILEDATRGEPRFDAGDATRSIWDDFIHTADEHNRPGTFSAIIGFEWTSTPGGNNLHRVVVFADGADKAGRVAPYTQFDSFDPEMLWKYLANYEEKTGGRVLAIPHNGNLSNGLMFAETDFSGKPLTTEYARTRMRWEPLIEVTQIKGDGETHPLLSPDDEFADYENWDVANIDGSAPKEDSMLKHEYGRSALKLGLELESKIGANPYKFGLSAATDSHTGLATSREENYFGKYAKTEPGPKRQSHEVIPASDPALRIMSSQEVASGLTAVWARENTRGAIFDAMARKEVYGTTGSRIRVRVFGGWDFEPGQATLPDFAKLGYTRGVPMGGDLKAAPSGKAPTFLIRAVRDPDGANLDRVQVIKGWLDDSGKSHERIYDVAVSDGRTIGKDGRCKQPVGNTVDLDTATFSNSIGDALFAVHWEDPDFDPDAPAFYYVRVLEIPTPRWTTYDAVFYGIDRPDTVPPTVQDRAYTSPIWYNP